MKLDLKITSIVFLVLSLGGLTYFYVKELKKLEEEERANPASNYKFSLPKNYAQKAKSENAARPKLKLSCEERIELFKNFSLGEYFQTSDDSSKLILIEKKTLSANLHTLLDLKSCPWPESLNLFKNKFLEACEKSLEERECINQFLNLRALLQGYTFHAEQSSELDLNAPELFNYLYYLGSFKLFEKESDLVMRLSLRLLKEDPNSLYAVSFYLDSLKYKEREEQTDAWINLYDEMANSVQNNFYFLNESFKLFMELEDFNEASNVVSIMAGSRSSHISDISLYYSAWLSHIEKDTENSLALLEECSSSEIEDVAKACESGILKLENSNELKFSYFESPEQPQLRIDWE